MSPPPAARGLRVALALGLLLLPLNLAAVALLFTAPMPPAHLPLEVAGAPDVRAARAAGRAPEAPTEASARRAPVAISALDAIFDARLRAAAAAAGRPVEPLLPDPALRAAARAATDEADPAVDALLRAWAAAMGAVGAPLRAPLSAEPPPSPGPYQ
ncbi:MAG: hypothetical protein JNM72_11905 [Deltaproteobacteria bacterium]|jgi:hypothetical protein|nr:hypothetical protein [Deltaproteobacteria bacterium]